ncbi:RNA polymerase sigma factor [Chitinophaga pinensis]|uniref:RNA polymerase, sigma-24 subunit, ECF subfamily n=1 Tax=Chitinophaga pinensis (strain ATCC 43595 / DSM 2588 / LMG 13176 / NBRC 15968 / NCIMB 11800 / UQM 2034) TaxID=485918 RepID=A0A979GUA7_CHIPD|nr:sigma-70 family RNA polymerase sigma factor [Chitinophaga pinensis]ACU60664.1 RNA polymerase, sigma-24 subunit, ECF subfamily [Chitinophaga pinensis DSM 2588]
MKEESTFCNEFVLRGLIEGDEQALTKVIGRYRDFLFMQAQRMLGDVMEADDVVQEVFIKLWNVKSKLKPDTSLDVYLSVLTKNASTSVLRKRKVWKRRHAGFTAGQSHYFQMKPMEDEELGQQLRTAFQQLSEAQQRIFNYVYIEDKSYAEIMQEHNLRLQTVKNTVSNALKKLRNNLQVLIK